MKKVKAIGLITIVVLIILGMTIVIIGYRTSIKNKEGLLTQKTIVNTLKTQGILIEKDRTKSPKDYMINGTKPDIFNVDKDKGTLLIYIYKSIEECRDTLREYVNYNGSELFKTEFKAKNTYLVYMPSLSNDTNFEEMESVAEIQNLISNIVFESFNDGKVLIFKGESISWRGTYTLKYYEYFWKDKTGKLNYESNHQAFSEIQYTMEDVEALEDFEFEYRTKMGGGNSTGNSIDKDGYSRVSNGGGSGAGPKSDEEITFRIKWNDLEESMILKVER